MKAPKYEGKFLGNFFTPRIVNEWANENNRKQTRILHEKPEREKSREREKIHYNIKRLQ